MGFPSAQLMKQGANTKVGNNTALKNYCGKVCDAVIAALVAWQSTACFKNIKINGPVALGSPGCLDGPKLESTIKNACPQSTTWEKNMSIAIATAISNAWENFEKTVQVPALPWYPAFAAIPSAQAPPMPNVPSPFIALPQAPPTTVINAIQQGIKSKAGSLSNKNTVADAIAAGFGAFLVIWLGTITVTNVLGKGPVPTFAPPYVPVGPVVNGSVISAPPHLT